MTSVATPAVTVAVPWTTLLSVNVTVPVGEAPVTVAVNVAAWPTCAGFGDTTNVVLVVAVEIVWPSTADVLPLYDVSPAYTAVTLCAPVVVKLWLKAATPELSVPVPKVVAPSLKVTVPVAVDGATVAVSAVLWPTAAGLTEDVSVVVLAATLIAWLNAVDVLVAYEVSPA